MIAIHSSQTNANALITSLDDDAGEIESLNTDVFRFLAIITLILAILFSLVQSMPSHSQNDAPQIANIELLQQNIQQLQSQVAELKQQVAASNQQVKQQYQRQLNTVQAKLNELQQQSEQKTHKLQQLQQQVAIQQNKLQQIAKQLTAKPKPTITSNTTVKTPAKPKTKNKTQVKQVPAAKPATQPAPKPIQKPAKVGFSLGFSSEQAFFNLFNQQVAKLYLVKGNKVWRIQTNMQLQQQSGAIELYYLASNTLPSSLLNKLKQRSSITNQSQFALALPASVVSQIKQHMQQHKGGDITIDAHGRVHIAN